MKVIKSKVTVVAFLSILICGLIISCKSPDGSNNSGTTIAADTAHTQPVVAKDSLTELKDSIFINNTKPMANQKPLTVLIKNLASATASVTVSVYGTENKFPAPKNELKVYKFTPHGKALAAEISDLPYGTYAIATYQDVNKSGKIDQNLLGVPKEPYAFSNNYKPVLKAPKFDDCKFDYDAKSNKLTITMIR